MERLPISQVYQELWHICTRASKFIKTSVIPAPECQDLSISLTNPYKSAEIENKPENIDQRSPKITELLWIFRNSGQDGSLDVYIS